MGLKQNILYSGFLTTSLYIFQFITYPYVARVLGVTNIGICNFVQSIVQYFALFSSLGIMTLGVREIAKCNGDKSKLDQTFSQLFTINAILTLSILLIYIIAIETIPQLCTYKQLLYIGASQIFFGLFVVEWLFRGIENFKYITLRTCLVRLCYVLSIFIFINDANDYILYFVIYSSMIVANGVINWVYRLRFVKYSIPSLTSLKQYIKPIFFLGTQNILTSLYTTFNILYLGMCCGDTQVGYYTTATKIENIILSLYSAFTLVMMPRISSLMASNNNEEVNRMINYSISLLLIFVFPCILFSEYFAEELVYLVAGGGYEGSVFPMRIVMPLMLIVGLEQILIVQILMPLRADKEVFINSVVGAVVSITLNIILVSKFESIGSSITWFASEAAVLITAIYFVRQRYNEIYFFKKILQYAIAFIPLLIGYYIISNFQLNQWIAFLFGGIVTLLYSHVIFCYVLKDRTYYLIIDKVLSKFHQ